MADECTPDPAVKVGITSMEVVGPNWGATIRRAASEPEEWHVEGDSFKFFPRRDGPFTRRVSSSLDDAVFTVRTEMVPLLERLNQARSDVWRAEQALNEWCRAR